MHFVSFVCTVWSEHHIIMTQGNIYSSLDLFKYMHHTKQELRSVVSSQEWLHVVNHMKSGHDRDSATHFFAIGFRVFF